MKLTSLSNLSISGFILFLMIIFCSKEIAAADQISEELSPMELDIKIEKETKKDYLIFIKNQKRKRSRLDTIISVEDQKKVEILRTTYDAMVKKERDDANLIMENAAPSVKEIFAKALFGANDRHMDRVDRRDCVSEIIKPMLEDEKLLAIVQDLNDKYSLRILEVRYGIFKEYEWFKEKEARIRLKYTKGVDIENLPPLKRRKSKPKTYKKDIYSQAWVLIINSK